MYSPNQNAVNIRDQRSTDGTKLGIQRVARAGMLHIPARALPRHLVTDEPEVAAARTPQEVIALRTTVGAVAGIEAVRVEQGDARVTVHGLGKGVVPAAPVGQTGERVGACGHGQLAQQLDAIQGARDLLRQEHGDGFMGGSTVVVPAQDEERNGAPVLADGRARTE